MRKAMKYVLLPLFIGVIAGLLSIYLYSVIR